MKKIIFMLTAVVFLFTACQKEEGTVNPTTATSESGFHKTTGEIVTKMIAGGGKYDENCTGIEVGTITVNDDGTTITVTYQITESGWMIDATHLYVGPEDSIPSGKKGNIKNGQFPYKSTHDPGVMMKTFSIPTPAGDYVIAAHADVSGNYDDSVEDFCTSLPETATVMVVSGEPVSYMTATISDAGWLDGVYESWCIDEEHGIFPNQIYSPADVYCTTNGDADGLVYKPQNFDNLNWLINQDFVGKISTCDGLAFTVMDVQYTIWYLMDDYTPPVSEQNCRQTELEYLALNDGEGFVPGCGDYVAVAFDPSYIDDAGVSVNVQKVIIEFPLVCGDETAWGYGYDGTYCDPDGADGISFTDSPYYGAKNWGWYFYGYSVD